MQAAILTAVLVISASLWTLPSSAQSSATTRQSRAGAVKKLYDSQPFELRERLPRSYQGHDPYALALALLKRPKKDTYETTSQYDERLQTWSKQPLYGSIRIGDTIAIHGHFLWLDTEYDADSQTMKFRFSSIMTSAEDASSPYLIIDSEHKSLSPATGQTAMGVKFRYERKAISEFGAKLQNVNRSDNRFEIKASPEAAKKHVIWSYYAVGVLSDPYYFSEEDYHQPTLTERYEQLVQSRGIVMTVSELLIALPSGEIIARILLQ